MAFLWAIETIVFILQQYNKEQLKIQSILTNHKELRFFPNFYGLCFFFKIGQPRFALKRKKMAAL